MGAVEARAELAADALGQLGGAEALDGVLGHLPLPVAGDGRGADPRDPLDYLGRGTRSSGEAKDPGIYSWIPASGSVRERSLRTELG